MQIALGCVAYLTVFASVIAFILFCFAHMLILTFQQYIPIAAVNLKKL